MQQAIRLQLQQLSPITFLRPLEWPFKESNISEIERRGAWGQNFVGPSFRNRRRVVVSGDSANAGGGELVCESRTEGGSHCAFTKGSKHLTPRQMFFISGRQISLALPFKLHLSFFIIGGLNRLEADLLLVTFRMAGYLARSNPTIKSAACRG
jgi:hypothetical protein